MNEGGKKCAECGRWMDVRDEWGTCSERCSTHQGIRLFERQSGAAAERALVVAWLREQEELELADLVESGEHRMKP